MTKKIKNNYSVSDVLRKKNKSNDYFEILLNNLTLEEVIALKLELGFKAIGFPLHNYPIWRSLNFIIRDTILKYALSASDSKREAASLLGLPPSRFFTLLKRYNINSYFKEETKNNDTDKR